MTLPNIEPSLTDSQKIQVNIISLNTRVNELNTDVAALNKTVLLGDRELPLVEQVRNHQKFIDGIQYWSRFVSGAIILQTITFGVAVILAVFKFLPVLEKLSASKP